MIGKQLQAFLVAYGPYLILLAVVLVTWLVATLHYLQSRGRYNSARRVLLLATVVLLIVVLTGAAVIVLNDGFNVGLTCLAVLALGAAIFQCWIVARSAPPSAHQNTSNGHQHTSNGGGSGTPDSDIPATNAENGDDRQGEDSTSLLGGLWPLIPFVGIVVVTLLGAAIANTGTGPGTPVKPPPPPAWKAEVAALRQRVAILESRLVNFETNRSSTAGDIAALQAKQGGLESAGATRHTALQALQKKTNAESLKLQTVKELAEDNSVILGQVSRAISGGGAIDAYVPDIGNAMDKPDFRKDFESAVERVLPQTGILRIHNETAVGWDMRINGEKYHFKSREVRSFRVPVGTIVTEIVGFEIKRSWFLGPPNNKLEIVIQ